MQQEHHPEVYRQPRQIEKGSRSRTREESADLIQVAHRLEGIEGPADAQGQEQHVASTRSRRTRSKRRPIRLITRPRRTSSIRRGHRGPASGR